MLSQPYLLDAPAGIAQKVRRIISQRKHINPRRLRFGATLGELDFDQLDVVDIILELERRFHLTIPDEIPLHTVGDFVSCVAARHSGRQQPVA